MKFFLCSLIQPCTVKIEHPAASIFYTNSSVSYSVLRHLILHVTGHFNPSASVFTKLTTKSVFSSKNEP